MWREQGLGCQGRVNMAICWASLMQVKATRRMPVHFKWWSLRVQNMFPPPFGYMRRKSETISKSSWLAIGGAKGGCACEGRESLRTLVLLSWCWRRLCCCSSGLDLAALSGAWHRRVLCEGSSRLRCVAPVLGFALRATARLALFLEHVYERRTAKVVG